MRKKHRQTLEDIFRSPVPTDISWSDAVSLLEAQGAKVVSKKGGSSRAVEMKGRSIVFHEPHKNSSDHMPRGMVRRLRKFLKEAGVKPS